MIHRAKISREDNGLWAGICDCSQVCNASRWRDAYDFMFYHVRARQRAQAQGIGFTVRKYDR